MIIYLNLNTNKAVKVTVAVTKNSKKNYLLSRYTMKNEII